MDANIERLHSHLINALSAAQEQYKMAQAAVAAAKAELKAAQAAGDLTQTRLLYQSLRNVERSAAHSEARVMCARGDLMRFENLYRLNRNAARRRRS